MQNGKIIKNVTVIVPLERNTKNYQIAQKVYYVHPPGGWIYYFCFFRRPMSDVRRPASDVRRPASRMVSAHLKEKY